MLRTVNFLSPQKHKNTKSHKILVEFCAFDSGNRKFAVLRSLRKINKKLSSIKL